MAWLFTTQSFIQIRQTIAKLQKKQKYGNPDLQKLNLSFAFPWHGQSPQTFVQIGVTIAELQKKQIYGNPDLKKSNLPFVFLWHGELSPKVSYKSGSLLQSYSIEKHMPTLNKKIKGIVQGPVTTGPTRQSFVKIRPGILECIAGQKDRHTDIQTSGQRVL